MIGVLIGTKMRLTPSTMRGILNWIAHKEVAWLLLLPTFRKLVVIRVLSLVLLPAKTVALPILIQVSRPPFVRVILKQIQLHGVSILILLRSVLFLLKRTMSLNALALLISKKSH